MNNFIDSFVSLLFLPIILRCRKDELASDFTWRNSLKWAEGGRILQRYCPAIAILVVGPLEGCENLDYFLFSRWLVIQLLLHPA